MSRSVKFVKGGKGGNGGKACSESLAKGKAVTAKSTQSLPPIGGIKNGGGGKDSSSSSGKSKVDTTVKAGLLPVLPPEKSHPPAPPSVRSSRRASPETGPQVAEFAYSKAVEYALRKCGFWSSRPYPSGYCSRYLEADIPRLPDIYQDYVFMRKCQTGRQVERRDMRPAVYHSYDEPRRIEQRIEHRLQLRTPLGRDTPVPKSLVSAMGQARLPSISVKVCVKTRPRPDSCSTASIGV